MTNSDSRNRRIVHRPLNWIAAVIGRGADAGVQRLSAGNYGGKLGPFHFHLQRLLPEGSTP